MYITLNKPTVINTMLVYQQRLYYITEISWPVTGPDGSMIVEKVSQMVGHKIFAGSAQIDWVPVLKLRLQFVKNGPRQARVGRKRSIAEVDVIPDVQRHVFWPVNHQHIAQVVKVSRRKAASPPHTDGSIVLARWRLRHLNASLSLPESTTRTPSWSVQPFLHSSRQSVVGHVRAWHVISPKSCPFTRGDLDPDLMCASFGTPTSQTASQSIKTFLQGSQLWQTDRQTTLLSR